jgi:hypothetical protein
MEDHLKDIYNPPPNLYVRFIYFILPVCLFIIDGWILSGILWFLQWALYQKILYKNC